MSSSTAEQSSKSRIRAAVVTVSDSCSRGERKDLSGPAVLKFIDQQGFHVIAREIIPDDRIQIQNLLINLARSADLIITTGGTGISARDVTPEATKAVCDKVIEGMAQRMRTEGMKKTPFAALSRGICGVRGQALIVNLPGSPTAAAESLDAIANLIPHAVDLLHGKTEHS